MSKKNKNKIFVYFKTHRLSTRPKAVVYPSFRTMKPLWSRPIRNQNQKKKSNQLKNQEILHCHLSFFASKIYFLVVSEQLNHYRKILIESWSRNSKKIQNVRSLWRIRNFVFIGITNRNFIGGIQSWTDEHGRKCCPPGYQERIGVINSVARSIDSFLLGRSHYRKGSFHFLFAGSSSSF